MDVSILDNHFLKINKELGKIAGIWPFQSRASKTISRFVVFALMTSCYITQYSRLIVYHSIHTVQTDYPYLIVGLGMLVKLGNYYLDDSKLETLIGGIYADWKSLRSEVEYNIMVKYAKKGVLVVLFYISHMTVVVSIFVLMPVLPPVLDMILPLNESRRHIYPYPAYYFVDMDKHYYLVVAHMNLVLILLACFYIACDTNYIVTIQHGCGLLAVSGYRFKHACYYTDAQNGENIEKSTNEMYRNACYSIQGHQRALKYINEIKSAHSTALFISVGLLMLCISVSLLKIADPPKHDTEWFATCVFVMAQLFHLLFLTIQGQFVMNSSDEIFEALISAEWYNVPPRTQALYVLALRKSLYPSLLTVGRCITLNLSTFAEIVKASVSYFTVMQSK